MIKKSIRFAKKSLMEIWLDMTNKIRYGELGPVTAERIWVNPQMVKSVIAPHPAEIGIDSNEQCYHNLWNAYFQCQRLSGRVIDREIENFLILPLERISKIRACERHWVAGADWEESGAIDKLMFKIKATGNPQSGCYTREDVVRRYEALDKIYAQVKVNRELKSVARRHLGFMREIDGVQIHLGQDGELFFGDTGTHRLAMARALNIPRIPASLGFVHVSGLDTLRKLRR